MIEKLCPAWFWWCSRSQWREQLFGRWLVFKYYPQDKSYLRGWFSPGSWSLWEVIFSHFHPDLCYLKEEHCIWCEWPTAEWKDAVWNTILACQLLYPLFLSLCSLFLWLTLRLILYFLFLPFILEITSLGSAWDTSGGQRRIVPRTPCGPAGVVQFWQSGVRDSSWSSNRRFCPCAVFVNLYTLVGFFCLVFCSGSGCMKAKTAVSGSPLHWILTSMHKTCS